jgi:mannose-6-phosphate isomerase-like protein (cupin superfamily)
MTDDRSSSGSPASLESDEAWVALSLALPPSPPPSDLRGRVMAAAERAAPYRPFLPPLAACFDLSERAVHDLLARMDDPKAWTPGVGATLAFLHFEGGPRLAESGAMPHCGVARMRSGARVPRHAHKAREVTFVLRGAVTEGEGRRFEAGQVLDMPPGSTHSLRITGEPDALLVVLLSEIEIVAAS